MHTTQEHICKTSDGYAALAIFVLSGLIGFGILISSNAARPIVWVPVAILLIIAGGFGLLGLYIVQPNQAAVLQLFGAYRGTVQDNGLRWSNPFLSKRKVSLRSNNLNMDKLKVNDKRGNPIEIAAAVVWKVEDSARAIFDVEDFQMFVKVQAEAALRHVATHFSYDDNGSGNRDGEEELTLLRGGDKFLTMLVETLQSRTAAAGIMVQEARLTHLAYAPEIAGVMLRRQQAEAVIAARQKIVEGAVGMVEMALKALSDKKVVHLDDERKAAMVSNLLVVLCADREVEPVINAGTLYH
ncbi:SPFH domain-containing protein [Collimonas pratensis]|uniref:SPFH domain-containing protein n=1 Tax=Collimonas pratensis TaxID=279113 RepID=UPI00143DE8B1|nr:SPFH domain-containing protein [Collimonas pratensis]NKI72746.1 SPFH domain-containing protein [Collimonas pratensis]